MMQKRISKKPMDVNQAAFQMVQLSTSEPETLPEETPKTTRSEISRIMAEMGRRGGKIGGKRRMKTMTQAQRTKIAKKAASARWKQNKSK